MQSMSKTALASAALIATTAAADTPFTGDVPLYQEQAIEAGIDHHYTGGFEFFVGGGAASFDCNDDRLPDLFLAGGQNSAKLYINHSTTGGALAFVAGEIPTLTDVTGAYPINLDNDEHMDLIALRLGENIALRGLGGCRFETANKHFALDGGRDWTTGFSAIWEAGAQFPTLAFGNYIDRDAAGSPWGTCADNQLIRPQSDAADFSASTPLSPGYCSLSTMFTDWNNRGAFDLRITNDRQYHRGGQEQMWSLSGGGAPRLFTNRDGWQKLVIWGMGIAQTDLTGDGKPEYALSSMGDTMLQSLDAERDGDQPRYRDIAFDRGTTAHRPYTGGEVVPSTGWHTHFADFNNDARSDLFIAKGNVEAMPDFAKFDPDNLLLGDWRGQFSEQGAQAGIALDRRGRGAVVTDFNADGMLDLLVVNRDAPASLFRNLGVESADGHAPMGNFLAIELDNGAINPQAVGAKIVVKTGNLTQTHTVQIGGGHASGQIGFVHFGLGVAPRARVQIKWPDGKTSQFMRVFANNFIRIERDNPEPKYWYPQAQN
ncbi:hypothetical protein GCM10007939_17640 [Amylibacter marinus]|uniref:ASPIC/UnbV domain-containing protein n=1 Tax=Amylibacter marinus TaxID=1475483 RepID=A0ABQ5VW84_9RHOB|nr:CRTAC1 family protein [Amylibacter marinus]GLQ35481.1 hypothetical protein GCM10007939_17640 [Amylibacter marinus]